MVAEGTTRSPRPGFRAFAPAAIIALAVVMVVVDYAGWMTPPDYAARGRAALAKGDYVEAIRSLGRAVEYCESDVDARYHLGVAFNGYGWDDEALEQYEDVWRLSVWNGSRAMIDAGRIWERRGDLPKAEGCFRRALNLTPDSADVWFELGNLLVRMKKFKQAVDAMAMAVRLEPENLERKRAFENLSAALAVIRGAGRAANEPAIGGKPNGGP